MGQVPAKWKMMGLNEKYILKEVLKSVLPENIVNRPKHPYRAPISQSLLNGNLSNTQELLSDHLLTDAALFDKPKIKRLLTKVNRSKQVSEFDNMALAGVISSQAIYRQFVQDFPSRTIRQMTPSLMVDKRTHVTTHDYCRACHSIC
jgi:asparagine synthase (glutamine-hydrolysing)